MTSKEPRQVEWNGETYPSIYALAKQLGVAYSWAWTMVEKGYRGDDDLVDIRKPIVWNGVEYPSQKALADEKGVSRSLITWYVSKGYTCDDDIG